MHKSFKKDAKRRFADVVQDIIKMTSKEEIIMFIQSQALNLDPQFKDQNLIKQINDYELQMLQTPIIAGKDKGKPIISVIKLEQHYKGFKATLAKNLKLKRKDRVEDALNATRAAVEEGIVTGGGCALLYAAQELEKVKAKGEDQKAGVDLVRRALEAPIRQITKNAGVDGSVVVGKLLEQGKKTQGYA